MKMGEVAPSIMAALSEMRRPGLVGSRGAKAGGGGGLHQQAHANNLRNYLEAFNYGTSK